MPNVSESYDRSPSPRTYSTGSTAILESGSKVLLLVSRTSTQNGVCRVGNGSSLASCPTTPPPISAHLQRCATGVGRGRSGGGRNGWLGLNQMAQQRPERQYMRLILPRRRSTTRIELSIEYDNMIRNRFCTCRTAVNQAATRVEYLGHSR